MQLSPNFTLSELTVTSTGLDNTPTPDEVEHLKALVSHVLQPLRDALGAPVVVNSAFRSHAVNRAVGGTPSSQHRSGQAADVWTRGMATRTLARKVIELALPFDQLIWYPATNRIHVSYGPRHRRQVLRYTGTGRYDSVQP